LFLVCAGMAIEVLARHTHRRSERFRVAGFTFHGHLDVWECPEGEHLRLHELDDERRLARYRARPHVCNRCPRKDDCTDSDAGREVIRHLDPWPYSEAGRYHRGIALVPVALAALVCVVSAIRHHTAVELLLASAALALTAAEARYLLAAFRRTPAGFPVPTVTPAPDAPERRFGRWPSKRPNSRLDPYAPVYREREEEAVSPDPRH
jgi:hypothetical protein